MAKLHQYDFYYGAILNTIISQNPDACPTLLEIGEEKSVYKVTTNSSEKDIIIFCKYATVKNNKSDNYKSWTFAFSDTDKDCIKKYHDKKYPVLISFLCKEQNLYYSEIVICTYNEFINVSYKKGITIGKEKNKKYFLLYTENRGRKDATHIKSNRIEMHLNCILADDISELKDIVKGDIVILESGSQICNDSIVTSGSLEVNESLLTGESDPVIKEVGSTLYSGSSVISGKACAEVIHVGNDNYATSLVTK